VPHPVYFLTTWKTLLLTGKKKPVIRNGKLYAENGLLTCLFHHYTRDRETTRKVGKWIEREWDEKRFTYSQFAKNGV